MPEVASTRRSAVEIEATLAAHPRIARTLVSLFRLRFDPAARDEQAERSQVNAIVQALEKVSNLSEDRVLRQLLALVMATLALTASVSVLRHARAELARH